MLRSLGLDASAESVYRAMLTNPEEGLTGLAQHTGIPESRVRQALDTLSELALVQPSQTASGRLRAVSPEVGLELLLSRQRAELAAHQQQVEVSQTAAAGLIAEYGRLSSHSPHPEVEQLVGLDEVRERLMLLTQKVDNEVLSFAPGGPQSAENMRASAPLNQQLLERGVRMRTIYLDSIRNSPATMSHAMRLAELGAEVRTVPQLPTRILILDRHTALIPVRGDDPARGALQLTGDGTLTVLCALFDTTWRSANPLTDQPVQNDEQDLTPQLRTVLELLAEGYTDESIAARLGVSPRTARRLAAELMTRLGARSRFQAGVRAVSHGWFTPNSGSV
ncbi:MULTISPECIES: LuxR C-terminal-related transcriptional regulator [unclassified Streptomyces]|uniref:LuxR C-terminal-related transcriptional regulator n=1 Tax=unclassified Streptomyces TaxID=2593676 RepID=UPI00332804FD